MTHSQTCMMQQTPASVTSLSCLLSYAQAHHTALCVCVHVLCCVAPPEYSFAGSQPMKSPNSGIVLFERHNASNASGLPSVQVSKHIRRMCTLANTSDACAGYSKHIRRMCTLANTSNASGLPSVQVIANTSDACAR